jgi:hypothetical protein
MTDGQDEPGFRVETPTVQVDASQATVRRLLDLAARHSGSAWPWLIWAISLAIVLLSAGVAVRLATR